MNPEDIKIYQVGVKGVLVNQNKSLALLKNVNGRTFWDVPGGRIQKGETMEQALKSELSEEVPNLNDYEVKNFLSAYVIEGANTVEKIDLLLLFRKIETDLEKVELSEEHQSYKWVSLEEIDSLEKEASISEGIKEALKLSLS